MRRKEVFPGGKLARTAVVLALLLFTPLCYADVPALTLISHDTVGAPGAGSSTNPMLDDSGSGLLFYSDAANLTADDQNGESDLFLADTSGTTMRRISVAQDGRDHDGAIYSAGILSGNGQFALFSAAPEAFEADAESQGALRIQPLCTRSALYVKDLQSGALTSLILTESGEPANEPVCPLAVNGSGQVLAFFTAATNVKGAPGDGTSLYLYDRMLNTLTLAATLSSEKAYSCEGFTASLSSDGRLLAYDAEVSDVSAEKAGVLTPACSETKKVVMLYDRSSASSKVISAGTGGAAPDGESSSPFLSADGRYLAFSSLATNLLPACDSTPEPVTQIYIADLQNKTIAVESVNAEGEQGNGNSFFPVLSAGGRYLAFLSSASNLVSSAGDDSGREFDLYLRDRQSKNVSRVNRAASGDLITVKYERPALSANGSTIAFSGERPPAADSEALRPACEDEDYQVFAASLSNDLDAVPVDGSTLAGALNAVKRMVRNAPPRIHAYSRSIRVSMQSFSRISVGRSSARQFGAESASVVRLVPSYEIVVLSGAKNKILRRFISTTSRVTIQLKAGRYKVKYRVLLKQSGTKNSHATAFSPATAVSK